MYNKCSLNLAGVKLNEIILIKLMQIKKKCSPVTPILVVFSHLSCTSEGNHFKSTDAVLCKS